MRVVYYNINAKPLDVLQLEGVALEHLLQHDVICLCETGRRSEQELQGVFNGYSVFSCSPNRNVKGMGLAIMVKREFCRNPQFLASPAPDAHQLLSVLFSPAQCNIATPLVLMSAYIPPDGSPQLQQLSCADRMNYVMQQCLAHQGSGRQVVVGGDWNARVAGRGSEDSNSHGNYLQHLSAQAGLTLLTGHASGDALAPHSFQRIRLDPTVPAQRTRVDHVLCSSQLCAHVLSTCVLHAAAGSDHFPLSATFALPVGDAQHSDTPNTPIPTVHKLPPKLCWQSDKAHAFTEHIKLAVAQGKFQQAIDILHNGGVNNAMDAFVQSVADAAIGAGHQWHHARTEKRRHWPWFDQECQAARKLFRLACARMRPDVHMYRNQYKSICRAKRRKWRYTHTLQLLAEAHKEPGRFWAKLSSRRALCSNDLDVSACVRWWKDLFHKTDLPPAEGPAGSQQDEPDHPLNASFEDKEILEVVMSLHNRVAAGSDGLAPEFIKYAVTRDEKGRVQDHILVPFLQQLFQWMFDNASLPDRWGEALLTLVFKGGDKLDWGNYRPIAVMQILAKIYGLVLNNRLNDWAERNGKRSPAQAGFRPGFSTQMNSFILQHLVNAYRWRRKPLFCCYVDLKKAYDTTIRQEVWNRLHHLGVKGKMLFALASFYRIVTCKIKFADGVSDTFDCNIGVRQGCPLSPFLFGVFVEILHDMIKQAAAAVGARIDCMEGALTLALLMFADDVVLIAESAQGLQILLDVLHEFCQRYNMAVNLKKTKVVVYHTQWVPTSDKNIVFKLNGQHIDVAKQYKYLGLIMAAARDLSIPMLAGVVTRGNASVASLYSRFDNLGISSNFILKRNLFDAIVKPNLTFGCEVWGPWYLGRLASKGPQAMQDSVFAHGIEKVRIQFYRTLLNLKKSTATWSLYRELGEYPFILFVARQCVRFYQKMLLDFPQGTWARVALIDAWRMHWLYEGESGSWFDGLITFMQTVGVEHDGVTDHAEHPVWLYDETKVEQRVRAFCHDVFLQQPSTKNRWYHVNFAAPIPDEGPWKIAQYLSLPVDSSKLALLSRLRLRNHHLKIETETWSRRNPQGNQGDVICTVCGEGVVDDENHFFFRCKRFDTQRGLSPAVFGNPSISSLLDLFMYDKSRPDWAATLRDAIRFLRSAGCIFSPAQ
jgi:exonuclease III